MHKSRANCTCEHTCSCYFPCTYMFQALTLCCVCFADTFIPELSRICWAPEGADKSLLRLGTGPNKRRGATFSRLRQEDASDTQRLKIKQTQKAHENASKPGGFPCRAAGGRQRGPRDMGTRRRGQRVRTASLLPWSTPKCIPPHLLEQRKCLGINHPRERTSSFEGVLAR